MMTMTMTMIHSMCGARSKTSEQLEVHLLRSVHSECSCQCGAKAGRARDCCKSRTRCGLMLKAAEQHLTFAPCFTEAEKLTSCKRYVASSTSLALATAVSSSRESPRHRRCVATAAVVTATVVTAAVVAAVVVPAAVVAAAAMTAAVVAADALPARSSCRCRRCNRSSGRSRH